MEYSIVGNAVLTELAFLRPTHRQLTAIQTHNHNQSGKMTLQDDPRDASAVTKMTFPDTWYMDSPGTSLLLVTLRLVLLISVPHA